MRIKIWHLLVFVFFTVTTSTKAQEKLLLLNGRELLIQPLSFKEDSVRFEFKDYLNGKKKFVKKDNVFSYANGKGLEKIFYKEDSTTVTNDLSIDEMRSYIQGMQEGSRFYKAPFATVGGFFIGAASGYFIYFYALIPPATFIAITGNHQPDISKQKVSDPALLQNTMFVNGYQKKCNEKKIKNATVGGLVGILAGAVLHQLLKIRF